MKSNIVDVQKAQLWYFIGFFKANFRLENGFKIIILVDTGAKINVITHKIIEDTGLAMQQGLKLEQTFYIGHNQLFFILCEDVGVAIRELKIRYFIFIIDNGHHNLVLSQLFLNLVKFS